MEASASSDSRDVRQAPLAIKGRWVICMREDDKENNSRVLDSHAVLIDAEGRIENIVPNEEVEALQDGYTVIDKSQHHALLPGLINCHAHMGMTLLRGFSDDKPLDEWLKKYIWPTEGTFMGEAWTRIGTELAAYEMLRTGTTTVNEMYFLPDSAIEVTRKARLRCAISQPIIDLGTGEIDDMVDRAVDWSERYSHQNDPFVYPTLSAHATYTVPAPALAKLAQANTKLRLPFHIHLHETKREVEDYILKHQRSSIQCLEDCGLLNSRCVAAHCVWLTKEEIQKFAQTEVNVCHNPRSNMKLASGIAPVTQLLEAGVNVCLGTDSTCSNNSLNLLHEVGIAALLAKVNTHDAAALDDYTALQLATINGAKALGLQQSLGSLEPGKWGDVIAVDLGEPDLLPVYCPISHIVYTTERRTTDVWVGGHHVVKDGKVLTVQIDKNAVQEFSQRIRKFKSEKIEIHNKISSKE